MVKVTSYDSLEDMLNDMAADQAAASEAAETHHVKVDDLRHGDFFASVRPDYGCVVFGEVIETMASDDPEEATEIAEDIRSSRENGYVFSKCYSPRCPQGELGDMHITRITAKIAKTVFDRAKTNGWRHLNPSN
jgi:hypothetical protein